MKTNYYKISLIFLVLLMSTALFAQKNLMYVGVTDEVSDTKLIEYLELEGYTVTFVSEDDYKVSPYDDAATYDGYDAILIGEQIGSSSVVNFKTAGFPIPCVSLEGYCVRVDRWDFITDNETQFKQASSAELNADVKTLVTTNQEHWITSELGTNKEIIWSTAEDATTLGVTGSKLNENVNGAVPLGIYKIDIMQEFPTLWAIPEGSTLTSDATVTLPNMVIYGTIATGLGDYATNEFNIIVRKSLQWVTGDYEIVEPGAVDNLKQYNLNVWPNPTNGIVNISFTLPESGNVSINIYDITGKLVETSDSEFLSSGYNTLNIDLSDMSEAYYIYEIIAGNDILRGKVCKQ